jgi:hypothetical protein
MKTHMNPHRLVGEYPKTEGSIFFQKKKMVPNHQTIKYCGSLGEYPKTEGSIFFQKKKKNWFPTTKL